MRWWARAEGDHLCGKCGGQIAKGQLVLWVRLAHIKRLFVRCVWCIKAEGAAPPDDLSVGT